MSFSRPFRPALVDMKEVLSEAGARQTTRGGQTARHGGRTLQKHDTEIEATIPEILAAAHFKALDSFGVVYRNLVFLPQAVYHA